MRIHSISIKWFRGSAEECVLLPEGRSLLVYGENGAGKSSFVDAVEYPVGGGRIRHLAFEHSGRNQEKAVINTHIPKGQKAEIHITFPNGQTTKVAIEADGNHQVSDAQSVKLSSWDYAKTILRQNEIAGFIEQTKGEKYSALLPLLGLSDLESAAENLRQLSKTIESQGKIRELKGQLQQTETLRKTIFGPDSLAEIDAKVAELHEAYVEQNNRKLDSLTKCDEIVAAIELQETALTDDQRRHLTQSEIGDTDLAGHVQAIRQHDKAIAGGVEPYIQEKLEILRFASEFSSQLQSESEITCPACGQEVRRKAFEDHIKREQKRLAKISEAFDLRQESIGGLCDSLASLKAAFKKKEIAAWTDSIKAGDKAANLKFVAGVDTDQLRRTCNEASLKNIEANFLPILAEARKAAKKAPRSVKALAADKRATEAAKLAFEASATAVTLRKGEALVKFAAALETQVRKEIRTKSKKIVKEISADIQSLWLELHPDQAIDSVQLVFPDDADKAIEIALRFHGVDQDSPRLTLSEGYRNSLGLCIFLAMALQDPDSDRPVILDDVVVSMDRLHRGMVAKLLEKFFSKRQIILLTHDRDWYTELRFQLGEPAWRFAMLRPYDSPSDGIRFLGSASDLEMAKRQLTDRPDSAGNDARKMMDVHLALIAEKLQVPMPYLRGEHNDRRMAHDFLTRLISLGKKAFKLQVAGNYQIHDAAILAFEECDKLLVTWANKASHTFDIVRPEAKKLINSCEQALAGFACPTCKKKIWFAESADSVQCQCGEIRWQFGKS